MLMNDLEIKALHVIDDLLTKISYECENLSVSKNLPMIDKDSIRSIENNVKVSKSWLSAIVNNGR